MKLSTKNNSYVIQMALLVNFRNYKVKVDGRLY
jgi:hypothetical protein